MAKSSKSRSGRTASASERIPRRPLPDFEETDAPMFKGVLEGGFLRVALKDVNQYGPHAMIMLLFVVATVTALALLLSASITPWFALQAVVFVFAGWWLWFRWRRRRALILHTLIKTGQAGDSNTTSSNGP